MTGPASVRSGEFAWPGTHQGAGSCKEMYRHLGEGNGGATPSPANWVTFISAWFNWLDLHMDWSLSWCHAVCHCSHLCSYWRMWKREEKGAVCFSIGWFEMQEHWNKVKMQPSSKDLWKQPLPAAAYWSLTLLSWECSATGLEGTLLQNWERNFSFG